jgi:hypothetical protein
MSSFKYTAKTPFKKAPCKYLDIPFDVFIEIFSISRYFHEKSKWKETFQPVVKGAGTQDYNWLKVIWFGEGTVATHNFYDYPLIFH